jgi:hypothetical protein
MVGRSKFEYNKWFKVFGLIVFVVLVFAFFDYLIHLSNAEYAVPSYYFKNKVIYGVLWGIVVYLLTFKWKAKLWLRSLFFSFIVALILQVRYAYEGYSLDFVLEFLFIHLAILWIVSYLTFRFTKI